MQAPLPWNEAARLTALRALDVLDTAPESGYDDAVRLASQICGTPIATVTLIDEARQWFKASVGLDKDGDPREISFCAHTILTPGETLVVEDARCDPRFADNPLVTGDPPIGFYAGAPLVTATGEAVGTICVIDHVPRKLEPVQKAALEALARNVMGLLEARRTVRALADALHALRKASVSRPLVRSIVLDLLRAGSIQPHSVRRLGENLGQRSGATTAEAAVSLFMELGLGEMRVAARQGARWTFTGHDLLERREDGARAATCFMSLGYLQGVVAHMSGRPTAGTETACQSRGDPECVFVVRARQDDQRSRVQGLPRPPSASA